MPTGIWSDQLLELIERGAQIVEVLGADDYAPVHLPGAINLPLRQLDAQAVAGLDRTRPIVAYCWDSL
jgi:rhodanese-related sulfurtransferase